MGRTATEIYYFDSPETASGVWSGNTDALYHEVTMLCVGPASSGTTYSFTLTDSDGFVVFSKDSREGDYVAWLPLGVRGVYTFAITGASADETFTIKLLYR